MNVVHRQDWLWSSDFALGVIQGSLEFLYHSPHPPHHPTDVLCMDFGGSVGWVVVAGPQSSVKWQSHFTVRAASSLALRKGFIRCWEAGLHLLSLTSWEGRYSGVEMGRRLGQELRVEIGVKKTHFGEAEPGRWVIFWMLFGGVFINHSYWWVELKSVTFHKETLAMCSVSVSLSVGSDSFATPWTVAHQAPLFMRILPARILEWVAISISRGSSQPRDWTRVSSIAGRFFTIWATRQAHVLSERHIFVHNFQKTQGAGSSSSTLGSPCHWFCFFWRDLGIPGVGDAVFEPLLSSCGQIPVLLPGTIWIQPSVEKPQDQHSRYLALGIQTSSPLIIGSEGEAESLHSPGSRLWGTLLTSRNW